MRAVTVAASQLLLCSVMDPPWWGQGGRTDGRCWLEPAAEEHYGVRSRELLGVAADGQQEDQMMDAVPKCDVTRSVEMRVRRGEGGTWDDGHTTESKRDLWYVWQTSNCSRGPAKIK